MRLRAKAVPTDKSVTQRPPRPVYPFAAIIGQEEMKLALLLNAVDPFVGGVLIMGHRGTGKSTAVRALADLLPQIYTVRGCLYGCDPLDQTKLCDDCLAREAGGAGLQRQRARVPVVDLPLGATEDRVCGTINIERALAEGVKAFDPGLLARAHRGFLYIDEVNLLEDHLVDLLLDVAATGRNVVEREGMSIEHPSSFVLVGSGNPEEGELRPQLLDRFGLHVEIRTAIELDQRVSIVENRDAFERNPARFLIRHEPEQARLRRKIARARKNLPDITVSRAVLHSIAELCGQLKVDGHRGELTITRSSRALAALEGRREVSLSDVERVAVMSLRHRLRRDPLDQTPGGTRIEQAMEKFLHQETPHPEAKRSKAKEEDDVDDDRPEATDDPGKARSRAEGRNSKRNEWGENNSDTVRPAPPAIDAQLPDDALITTQHAQTRQKHRGQAARHQRHASRAVYNTRRGRYTRAVSANTDGAKIALDATFRAALSMEKAAVETRTFKVQSPSPYPLTPVPRSALRYKQYKRKSGVLFIFAVDTSGSMALNRIGQAKGLMARLLQKSYIRRDRLALVAFRGESAEVVLPPTSSAARARRIIDTLYIGGATPLASALLSALQIAARAARQGTGEIILLLLTDGHANMPLKSDQPSNRTVRRQLIDEEITRLGAALQLSNVEAVVIDTQSCFTSNGEGQALADKLGARHVRLTTTADDEHLDTMGFR